MGCGSSSEAPANSTAEVPASTNTTQPKEDNTNSAQPQKETKEDITPSNENASGSEAANDDTVVSPEAVEITWKQIHSAIRWKKPTEEVKGMLTEELANSKDTGNGNYPLHIAAQNGHLDHVKLLLENKADVNCQNKKGNTPLHMSLSYDYIEVSEFLIAAGADMNLNNEAGIPARKGLEGDKCLAAVYFAAAETTAEVMHALNKCQDSIEDLDKASFASTGLRAKKRLGDDWTDEVNTLFREIVGKM
mmetsp:Transcript_8548/g.12760  ORF Transcript_8548/g.12760 Transcript_8548/m.12760 type:complete len:248 (+) Transcript_8548:99-842(+)|eukprot:CAMPEP_0185025606 /NCGR_PEP_ID=MMETSP1103-20130426/8499_1 /TAXON_ID=36769 /ORGANISM="Paraphysomonas bandaiensis, Strain Caron Lab Isolate" /LENGTH=247 /DNA_ID=CAMNT_0027558845 /DNA_START=74 /DNA_END=817 /DNA_ORIENTATION=+